MKIYTRGGDKGKTGIFGGTRVPKDDIRVECYGTLDEANSRIGFLRARLEMEHPWQTNLHKIQVDLMNTMSRLSTPSNCPKENMNPLPLDSAAFCEKWMDQLEEEMDSSSDYFLLPGGSEIAALCHMVRTDIRRGERRLVTLMREDDVHESIPQFINRLSDLFFILARADLFKKGMEEEKWRAFLYKKRPSHPKK